MEERPLNDPTALALAALRARPSSPPKDCRYPRGDGTCDFIEDVGCGWLACPNREVRVRGKESGR